MPHYYRASTGVLVAILVMAPATRATTTVAFDWNVGNGTAAGVPSRYAAGVRATVGDTLVLSWQDPTTTPAGAMFHEVSPMEGDTCTFLTGYTSLAETAVTTAGVKVSVSSTILLDTAGTFQYSCGIGSAAWCASNTSTVLAATGGYGCSGDQAWAHCGSMFQQKLTVVVTANVASKPSSAMALTCASAVTALAAMAIVVGL